MKPQTLLLTAVLSLCTLNFAARAERPDVAGTWKWMYERNGESREIVMKLQQDGAKVMGEIAGPDGNTVPIHEGKVGEDGKMTFFLQIDRDGNSMKINFSGKASADTITGKTTFINPQGEEREREWTAKRDAKSMTPNLTGEWNSAFKLSDGRSVENTLKLKQEGDKLMGTTAWTNGSETEIRDGKIKGDEVMFTVIRERDGRKVTSKYSGKIQSKNSIKGQMESDWSGEFRKLEWEAKKQ